MGIRYGFQFSHHARRTDCTLCPASFRKNSRQENAKKVPQPTFPAFIKKCPIGRLSLISSPKVFSPACLQAPLILPSQCLRVQFQPLASCFLPTKSFFALTSEHTPVGPAPTERPLFNCLNLYTSTCILLNQFRMKKFHFVLTQHHNPSAALCPSTLPRQDPVDDPPLDNHPRLIVLQMP